MNKYIVTVESSQWCGCSETQVIEAESIEEAEIIGAEWAADVMAYELKIEESE